MALETKKYIITSPAKIFGVAISSINKILGVTWAAAAAVLLGKISAGQYHSIYTKNTVGLIWNWGNNLYGQLGDNSTVSKLTPVSILGGTKTFCSISCGNAHSIGIDNRGLVWSWGRNQYGQLGDNTDSNKSTPVSILGSKKTFCSISCGYYHSVGIDNRGLVWGWGYNIYNQLAYYVDQLTPIRVCSL